MVVSSDKPEGTYSKPVQTQNRDWYMVYLCGRPMESMGKDYCILGRETALDPITWTADEWPLVNMGKGSSVIQHKPNLPEHPWTIKGVTLEFMQHLKICII